MRIAAIKFGVPIALAIGTLFSCKNDIAEIKALTEDRDLAVQMVENGTFYYTSRGNLSNRLEATYLERFELEEDSRIEVSKGFTLTMFDSLENVDATLTADEGTFFNSNNKLIAKGNVELQNRDGEKLNSEELIFAQDSDLIYTDKNVMITTNESVIHSKGLTTDSQFKKREFTQVTGIMYIDDPIEKDTLNGPTTNDQNP